MAEVKVFKFDVIFSPTIYLSSDYYVPGTALNAEDARVVSTVLSQSHFSKAVRVKAPL